MNTNLIADTFMLEAATQPLNSRVVDDCGGVSDLKPLRPTASTTPPSTHRSKASSAFELPTRSIIDALTACYPAQLRFPWRDVVWRNVIAFVFLHWGALYGLYLLAFGYAYLSTFLLAYTYGAFGAMGITAGAHRHWAHKSFKAKWPLKLILTACNTIAFQNSIFEWVRDHRVHHKFTDTDADPHNVSRGLFFAHMGWLLVKKHPDVRAKGSSVDMSDLEKDAFVMFQKKYYMWLMPVLCFLLPTYLQSYINGDSLYNSFYAGTMLRYTISLHSTWLVNSAAHVWGYKPYDGAIKSANNIFVAVIAYGEGWHNYHHVFPWDYKTAELGDYSMNFTTAFIDFFANIGWAYDLKTVSEEMITKRAARTGDGTNHHSKAIPAHRTAQNKSDLNEHDDHHHQHHQHQHHQNDHENSIWGWDDEDMPEMDRKDALIINKKDH